MFVQSDPFRDLDALVGRLAARAGAPGAPMDVYRRGNDVWVHMDLPGVAAESIDISVERGMLTISGERRWIRQEGDRVYVNERYHGAMKRQLQLGDGLNLDAVEADYHDGVLTLRIPVAQQAQPRRIRVSGRGAGTAVAHEAHAAPETPAIETADAAPAE